MKSIIPQEIEKVVQIYLILVLVHMISYSEAQIGGTSIKFKLSALNLPNKDIDGTSDPFVKLFSAEGKSRSFVRFGETNVVHGNANPAWDETFLYLYVAGKNQRWKFLVKDWDFSLIADDHLGRAEVKVEEYLNEIQRNGGRPVQLFLTNPKGGVINIIPVN